MLILKHAAPSKRKGGECPALIPKMLIDLAVALAQERQCDHPEDDGTADRIPVDDGPVSVGASDILFLRACPETNRVE
jgi:hypothetical protein